MNHYERLFCGVETLSSQPLKIHNEKSIEQEAHLILYYPKS